MGKVEPKGGLANAFFGAVAGVVLLLIIQVILAASSGGDVKFIPTLTFDGSPFKFLGDYLGFFFTTTLGLIVLIGTILFYAVGTYYVQKSKVEPPGTDVVENETAAFMRGLLIAFGSSLNLVLADNIYGAWFGQTVGLIIGVVLFVLGMLAAIKEISQSAAYEGIVGWLCWLAPMSWPILLLGLILLILSLVGWLVSLLGIDFLKVGGDKTDPLVDTTVKGTHVTANWATGTFFLVGGLAGNINYAKTAYNMGNVGFIYGKAQKDHRAHESGHNLSLFVFGWIYHLVGALDENVLGRGQKALAEMLAESHDSGSTDPKLEVWA